MTPVTRLRKLIVLPTGHDSHSVANSMTNHPAGLRMAADLAGISLDAPPAIRCSISEETCTQWKSKYMESRGSCTTVELAYLTPEANAISRMIAERGMAAHLHRAHSPRMSLAAITERARSRERENVSSLFFPEFQSRGVSPHFSG